MGEPVAVTTPVPEESQQNEFQVPHHQIPSVPPWQARNLGHLVALARMNDAVPRFGDHSRAVLPSETARPLCELRQTRRNIRPDPDVFKKLTRACRGRKPVEALRRNCAIFLNNPHPGEQLKGRLPKDQGGVLPDPAICSTYQKITSRRASCQPSELQSL